MGEDQGIALHEIRLDELLVDHGLNMVLGEDLDQVGFLRSRLRVPDFPTVGDGVLVVGRAGQFGDDDFNAAVAQAQGLGAALNPVADNPNLLPVEKRKISVVVVEHLCSH
ncbi:MAG: hypothetical protein BWY75_01081 [bacterium ADurb.Bin425]|nr:MAG: hypothetical protein BWY75_01081 [bacterium ADurb.Bin425]